MARPKKIRITLAQLFGVSFIVLIALLGLLFYFLFNASRASVIEASDDLRDAASRELADRVTSYLNQATEALDSFQEEITHEVFNPKDPVELETFLFSLILTNPNLSEISFTYGEKTGYDARGDILLAPTGRGAMSLFTERLLAPLIRSTPIKRMENGCHSYGCAQSKTISSALPLLTRRTAFPIPLRTLLSLHLRTGITWAKISGAIFIGHS